LRRAAQRCDCEGSGEAIAVVRGASAIDAIVMASAALRGDVLYTSHVEDLERLRSHFRAVRVALSLRHWVPAAEKG